jgi:MraZ protein
MFRGANLVQLDAKGRLTLPTRYRTQLLSNAETNLIVTINTEEACLLLYPLREWEVIEKKIQALPSFHKATRRIQRLLIGHATDVELDGSGRFLLPPLLREYANLDKQVMLIGQGKKFEIWSEALWSNQREQWLAEEKDKSEPLPAELESLSL